MFNVIKSLVAPEFPERKGSYGWWWASWKGAGLEAGQAQEVYYLWFLDSHSSQGGVHGELMEMTVGEEAEDLQEHSWTFKTHSYEAPIEESLHI